MVRVAIAYVTHRVRVASHSICKGIDGVVIIDWSKLVDIAVCHFRRRPDFQYGSVLNGGVIAVVRGIETLPLIICKGIEAWISIAIIDGVWPLLCPRTIPEKTRL